jgi:DNA-binding CsgD family transcriptional regulator
VSLERGTFTTGNRAKLLHNVNGDNRVPQRHKRVFENDPGKRATFVGIVFENAPDTLNTRRRANRNASLVWTPTPFSVPWTGRSNQLSIGRIEVNMVKSNVPAKPQLHLEHAPSPQVAELLEALMQVMTDQAQPSSQDAQVLWDAQLHGARYTITRQANRAAGGGTLSPREQEIVRLVAKGLPNKCVADVLEISPWTVATYLRRIFVKLGVGSRAAMIATLSAEGFEV